MDLSFFRRAEGMLAGATPARLDFGLLTAILRAERMAAAAEAVPVRRAAPVADPIAEILLVGPAWREAVAAQGGCFNARYARQGVVN